MKKTLSYMVVAGLAITSVLAAPYAADARSVLDKLLGKDDENTGPPPEETLQAPFPTTPPTSSETNALVDMYGSGTGAASSNSSNLDQPHRNQKQIIEWASGIVSLAMTIQPATWDSDFAKISAHFTPYAATEYKDYLQKSNIMTILTSNNMRLQAVSSDEGVILKEGALSGTYHWLVQIPLMTSFYSLATQEIDTKETSQTQSFSVQVQVGRVPAKDSADIGLVVERWAISAAPRN